MDLSHLSVGTREARARRELRNSGYMLKKTPARSSQREYFGVGYMVVDLSLNIPVVGGFPRPYAADLEEVEDFIRS